MYVESQYDTTVHIYKTEIDSQTQRTDLWLPRGKLAGEETDWEFGIGINSCKLLYTGWINNKFLLYNRGNYIQYPVINHNGKEYEKVYFGHLMRRVDSLEKTLCREGLGVIGEGDDRGWDGWMASLTWWTWVWVNSRSWWWTGRPGVLRFMGSQRVGHSWVTELNWLIQLHHFAVQ